MRRGVYRGRLVCPVDGGAAGAHRGVYGDSEQRPDEDRTETSTREVRQLREGVDGRQPQGEGGLTRRRRLT